MPILNCPTCGSKLEVAAEDLGHVVQCGSCQQTFTADDPAKPKSGGGKKPYSFKDGADEDERPSKKSSRRDRKWDDGDDDHDPDADYRPRSRRRRRDEDVEEDYERRYRTPQTGMGVTSMVLGIVSIPLTFCYGFGIPAAILGIIFGILSLKTEGRGMGIAGIILSALALLLLIGAVVFYIMMMTARAQGGGGRF